MYHQRPESVALVLFLVSTVGGTGLRAGTASAPGVLVDKVSEGSALARAGIEPGDVLVSWQRRSGPQEELERGKIASVFDWAWLRVEQAPRGNVELHAERRGTRMVFSPDRGSWAADVLPRMLPGLLESYSQGREWIESARYREGIAVWEAIAGSQEDSELFYWLELEKAQAWAQVKEWDKALAAYHAALDRAPGPAAAVAIWNALATQLKKRGRFDEARRAYRSALEIRVSTWGEKTLGAADSKRLLGSLALAGRDLDLARSQYQEALAVLEELAPASLALANVVNSLGIVAAYRDDNERAEELLRRALALREKLAPLSRANSGILANLGAIASDRGDYEKAEGYLLRALAVQQESAPGSKILGNTYHMLGFMAQRRERLADARKYYESALSVYKVAAPISREAASAYNNLGNVVADLGELDLAEEYQEQALAIREQIAPGGLDMASSLNNLGILASQRGDLEAAMAYQNRALDLLRVLAPESLDLARSLSNLGSLASARGDLDLAADYARRALAIQQKLAPGSVDTSNTLNNLGNIAADQADFDLAEVYHKQALEIRKKIEPEGLSVAMSLQNLGQLERQRGRFALARSYQEKSLAIRLKHAPQSLDAAKSLTEMGSIVAEQGDTELGIDYHLQALALLEGLAPRNVDIGRVLFNLGELSMRRGENEAAERYLRRSLTLEDNLTSHALAWKALADLQRSTGRWPAANESYRRALELLENQVSSLGGSRHTKGGFRAEYNYFYKNYLRLLIEMGDTEQAFHVLERSRARSLLELIAERDLTFPLELSDELEGARRRITARYDQVQEELEFAKLKGEAKEIESFRAELHLLREEYDRTVEEITQKSPKLGSIRYPKPLDLQDIPGLLDAGTVMLAYSVAEEGSHLFTITHDGRTGQAALQAKTAQLRDEIHRFRQLIQDVRPERPAAARRRASLDAFGRHLYDELIGPVAEVVAGAERILVVPDGPLHLLPFGALVRDSDEETARPQYLAAWKPIHVVLSGTLYGELKRSRRPRVPESSAPPLLVAFADPQYPAGLGSSDAEPIGDVRVRSAAQRGLLEWQPLPNSRREVDQLSKLYPVSRVYLGEEATEERAKSIGTAARVVHFATHGFLDDRFPLNSGLALTIPSGLAEGRDNGLFQAWEIFERLRLDADLVVLSACQSALGRDQGGDGLIGLTQAFQFAGARSVMASLWEVSDRATAELMVRFHRHLRAGMAKDLALQAAQLELLHGPIRIEIETGESVEVDASAPYFWASFQLYGDYR